MSAKLSRRCSLAANHWNAQISLISSIKSGVLGALFLHLDNSP
jgi:hypothetical protein